ncbi:MAG: hypothetical protein O3C40_32880 [Planctomycetota bacterium]|nr:hypothetical protein [Planctomycetota bacterium]
MSLAVSFFATTLLADEPTYVWGKDQRGMQAGARVLSATGKLQSGDPIVVEFVLKNTSDEEQTLVVQQYDDTYPTLGANNRIELNILGSSQRKWQHNLKPDEVLRKRQYRVSLSTEGFPPGNYHITAGSAFWLTADNNSGTGVPHGRHISITIGDPDSVRLSKPPTNDDLVKAIHWGDPVAGLIVGARLPGGKAVWKYGEDIQADLFLFNASEQPITVTYELPAHASDWNLHLSHESNEYVRLDSIWFTGVSPHVTRQVTVAPDQQIPITGIEAEVSVGGNIENKMIAGPTIRLLGEPVEFQPGDPKRLIGGKGTYTYHAAITMHRADILDAAMVLSAGDVVFSVHP